MINDETTWHCINQGFCSFKVKIKTAKETFCRNQYNVTGLCNRVSCPLANSEYATVLEKEGICYLYIKTVERAHTPNRMWEKIELSKNYMEALKQIDDNLLYWADHKKNRCKQRLTKFRQMLLRQRKMVLNPKQTQTVGIKKKTERREATREEKAEKAAQVELAIERELLDRLKQGTYGDLYNLNSGEFNQILDNAEEELEEDEEAEKLMEMEDEDEEVDERNVDYVVGDMEDDDEWGGSDDQGLPSDEDVMDDLSDEENPEDAGDLVVPTSKSSRGGASSSSAGDIEDLRPGKKPSKRGDKKPKIEIEYEEEGDTKEKLLA